MWQRENEILNLRGEKATWNVRVGIFGILVLSHGALGNYVMEKCFPTGPSRLYVCNIRTSSYWTKYITTGKSATMAIQPCVRKQGGGGKAWYSVDSVKEMFLLSWSLRVFPIQLIGTQKCMHCEIKAWAIWGTVHHPVERLARRTHSLSMGVLRAFMSRTTVQREGGSLLIARAPGRFRELFFFLKCNLLRHLLYILVHEIHLLTIMGSPHLRAQSIHRHCLSSHHIV